MDQKIKVVTLDSDTAPAGRSIFINQASSEGIGQSLVQTLAKAIGNSGDFAILSATPNATNQNTWIKYITDEKCGLLQGLSLVSRMNTFSFFRRSTGVSPPSVTV